MKLLNFGSLNIDQTYQVEHFVNPGETIQATGYTVFCGGKGLNQSVALAKAGATVYHAGAIGQDGDILREQLENSGVKTDYLMQLNAPSGHAMIQIDPTGQNCILVHGGANHLIETQDIDRILKDFSSKDFLLLQNELKCTQEVLTKAKRKGMTIALNPSPVTKNLIDFPLDLVDFFILNEIEAQMLLETTQDHWEAFMQGLTQRWPQGKFVLTLGAQGAHYFHKKEHFYQPIFPVQAVDTTAAGDTFTGYFLASYCEHGSPEQALGFASAASALCVTHRGASQSIPEKRAVEAFLNKYGGV